MAQRELIENKTNLKVGRFNWTIFHQVLILKLFWLWGLEQGQIMRVVSGKGMFLGFLILSGGCADKGTFIPEHLEIPRDPFIIRNNEMTETAFNTIIDAVVDLYAPEVRAAGAELVIERFWTSSTINAKAIKLGTTWKLSFYGGLARRYEITPDAFLLVVCHEMGHLIGGRPFYPLSQTSNEGQSDYWATLECARRVWDPRFAGPQQERPEPKIPTFVEEQCKGFYEPGSRTDICLRSNRASFSVGLLFAHLEGAIEPSFSTPDQTIVDTMLHSHAPPQCRLDTYYAGAMGWSRPACWYRPEAAYPLMADVIHPVLQRGLR